MLAGVLLFFHSCIRKLIWYPLQDILRIFDNSAVNCKCNFCSVDPAGPPTLLQLLVPQDVCAVNV